MRAKFVYEAIEDFLKPKSEEEINDTLKGISDKDLVEGFSNMPEGLRVKEIMRRGTRRVFKEFSDNDLFDNWYFDSRVPTNIRILELRRRGFDDNMFINYLKTNSRVSSNVSKELIKTINIDMTDESIYKYVFDHIETGAGNWELQDLQEIKKKIEGFSIRDLIKLTHEYNSEDCKSFFINIVLKRDPQFKTIKRIPTDSLPYLLNFAHDKESVKNLIKASPPATKSELYGKANILFSGDKLKFIKSALQKHKINPNIRTGEAFRSAISVNNYGIIKKLLAHPDITIETLRRGLEVACRVGDEKTIKLLLKDEKMDITSAFTFGTSGDYMTPLVKAAKHDNIDVLKVLINDPRIDPRKEKRPF